MAGWGKLPTDIVHRILSSLPFRCKLRCKSVASDWNQALSDDPLFVYTTNFPSDLPNPAFLLCTSGDFCCSLDPSTDSWHTIATPSSSSPGSRSILAASGSVACIGNQVSECRTLSVVNPVHVSSSAICLPSMPRVGLIHKVSIAVDHSTASYVIVVTGEDSSSFRGRHAYRLLTDVYDSVSRSWTAAGDALPDAKFGSDPGAWCNGLFYCITELPYGLTAFDVAKGNWVESRVPMPEDIACPSLISVRKQLLMVGIHSNSSQISPKCIRIWSLCPGKLAWELLHQMPEDFSTEFMSHLTSRTPLVCAGVGDKVCITSHLSPAVVVCDVGNSSWKWMVSDPFFPKNRDTHLLGFSFHPNPQFIP